MTRILSEDTVEQAALEWLSEIGYETRYGLDIVFRQTGQNDHRFDFAARPADGRLVAGLMLEYMIKELA